MNKSHILFVINPKSGGTDKSGLDKIIKKACAKAEQSYTIHYTTGENDLAKLEDKLESIEATTVVACGGDGTVNLVAKGLLNREVNLGIIPLGSANGLANEFDIPEDEEESLDLILKNSAQAVDVVCINDDHISIHLSDVGFNAQMIREFEKDQVRGKFGYAKAFFKSILNRESESYEIYLDGKGEAIHEEAEMLVFANASSYGTGAIINPDSQLDDGLFEVIVFKPIPFSELPSLTFESFFGNIKDSPFVKIYQAKEAKIVCKKRQLLQIDGELLGEMKEIDLKIMPAALQLIK